MVPSVKSIRISADDAFSLRQLVKEKKFIELSGAGFRVDAGGGLAWRAFDLVEQPG
jgi:hypothetical protein